MKSDIENKFDDNEAVLDRHYSAAAIGREIYAYVKYMQ